MNVPMLTALFQRHRELGRYTIIDGDPGAGKTSAIRAAVKHVCNTAVLKELNHIEQSDKAAWHDPQWIENWYIASERERQEEVNRLLAAGNHVLQDRSLLSTLAFAYASHAQCKPDGFVNLLQRSAAGPAFIAPDTLLIMQVMPSASLHRRMAFSDAPAYSIWFDALFLERFHAFFQDVASLNLAGETIVIDTSAMSLDEVKRNVVTALQRAR